MTGESEAKTKPWIEQHGVQYAYAYDKKTALSRKLGVRGIPQAFLVDPSGKIVWSGHPASLTDELVTEYTRGALPMPLWKWPKAVRPIAKLVLKRQLGKALLAAEKLVATQQKLSVYRDTVRSMVDRSLVTLEETRKAGNFLAARDLAKDLRKGLAGLPEAAKAAAILKEIQADKAAKVIMTAQKRLAVFRKRELKKQAVVTKLIKAVTRLGKKHPDTFVAQEAERFAAELRKWRRPRR